MGSSQCEGYSRVDSMKLIRAGPPMRPGEATASGGRIHRDSRSQCQSSSIFPDVDLLSPLLLLGGETSLGVHLRCQKVLNWPWQRDTLSLKCYYHIWSVLGQGALQSAAAAELNA